MMSPHLIQRNYRKTKYHSSEQQSHEQGPRDQEEDDEDADDFIKRSLQPHDHLRTQMGGNRRKRGREKRR